ncbi:MULTISPECIES: hypothetical protein [Rosenbergiella]|uniref:hypothetical protein n=1 Tax=Rosenbergiella TaxID=1356488 RepID=UPI001F4DE157|nr:MULTISPECIES: hypothetical protein [Rosenbergiella]
MRTIKLSDLHLKESVIFSLDFKQSMRKSGEGKVRLEYGEVNLEAGGKVVGDEEFSVLLVRSNPMIEGLSIDDNGNEVHGFHIKMELRLSYTYKSELTVTPEFMQESQWFIASQVRQFFKIYSEDILNKSSLTKLHIPY